MAAVFRPGPLPVPGGPPLLPGQVVDGYPFYDKQIQRSVNDYTVALTYLYPDGPAWPKWDNDSIFMSWVAGCASIWADVDAAANQFLRVESWPQTTQMMLPDWEAAFGLPDDCLAEPVSIGQRQAALTGRLTLLGSQSRNFFVNLAASIGYDIAIIEHSPYQCGISVVGDTTDWNGEGAIWYRWECGAPTMRFYWTVDLLHPSLTWFRVGAGGGQCGIDPMLRIGLATDLECLITRYKPAHTMVLFRFRWGPSRSIFIPALVTALICWKRKVDPVEYNAPYGSVDLNAPYINGNPVTATPGSVIPAAGVEYDQREIINAIITVLV